MPEMLPPLTSAERWALASIGTEPKPVADVHVDHAKRLLDGHLVRVVRFDGYDRKNPKPTNYFTIEPAGRAELDASR